MLKWYIVSQGNVIVRCDAWCHDMYGKYKWKQLWVHTMWLIFNDCILKWIL
jgi:hypothetical protein